LQGIKDTLKGTYIEVLLEDSQADVTITTQKTSMVLAANPDLTGLIGLDSQAPMGIVTAVDEARKTGKIIITVNEAGLEFFQNIPNGKVLLITMEKYDVMEYIALSMLYMWHNDAIRPAGLDPWTSNWMPSLIDSGLIVVTKDNVAEVVKYYTEQQKASK
jgi:ABC-type sugar transport system substrate-binding protein